MGSIIHETNWTPEIRSKLNNRRYYENNGNCVLSEVKTGVMKDPYKCYKARCKLWLNRSHGDVTCITGRNIGFLKVVATMCWENHTCKEAILNSSKFYMNHKVVKVDSKIKTWHPCTWYQKLWWIYANLASKPIQVLEANQTM